MSETDAPSTADRIIRLGELVDRVESEGVTIVDVDTAKLVQSGDLQATIDLRITDVPADEETADETFEAEIPGGMEWVPEEVDVEEIVDELEGEDDDQSTEPDNEPAPATPTESDTVPDDVDDNQDEDGADATDDTANEDDDQKEFEVGDEVDDDADDTDQTEEAEPEDIWCGVCGAGPFEMLSIHAGRVHDGDEIPLDHEPAVAELTDPPAEMLPDYEGEDPEAVVADSSLPPHLVLDDVLDAAVDATRADAPVVSVVTGELGVRSDEIEPVLRELDLQQPDRRMLVDDVGERVAAIRAEVADA